MLTGSSELVPDQWYAFRGAEGGHLLREETGSTHRTRDGEWRAVFIMVPQSPNLRQPSGLKQQKSPEKLVHKLRVASREIWCPGGALCTEAGSQTCPD